LNVDLTFFENKELNTFWEIEDAKDTKKYLQITYKDYFNEDISNSKYVIFKKSKMKVIWTI